MNEQERGMIDGLFEKLQQAESQAGPRDREAEALIGERMAKQPGAAYMLAQVVLVQEQGLKNLQGRVEDLERQLTERPQGGGGFLGGLFGGGQSQAPTRAAAPTGGGWGNPGASSRSAAAMQQGGQGGGFLAGAMQTAVGVAGGMLLGNAVAGLFSGDAQAAEAPVEPPPPVDEPEDLGVEDEGGGFFDGGLFGGDDEEF